MKPLLYTVCPRPPHPTRDGAAIRNYHLLAALSREFRVRTFVLIPPHLRGDREQWPEGIEIERFAQVPRAVRRATALAGTVFGGRAYPPLLYRSRSLVRRLRERAAEERPRWVLAQSYHVATIVPEGIAQLWIDFHNVDSEIWRRLGGTASSRLTRTFARSQAPRVSRIERKLMTRAAGVSCVSDREADLLGKLAPGVPTLVVPNGVDLDRYRFRAEPPAQQLVVFVGDLTWPPNREGIRWFQREVWPILQRLQPAARVDVLGRGATPSPDVRSRFVFLGECDDTRESWSRAAVAIVPIRAAAGTRLKILEAAACGVPVVSTSIGVEGLLLRAGTEILVCDDAEGFARSIARLLGDPGARRRQALAARRLVEAFYGWDRIGREFTQELLKRSSKEAD